MFKAPTVFVLGAGASAEAGLPIGKGLKSQIAKRLDIRFGEWGTDVISGDTGIIDALRAHCRSSNDPRKFNLYQDAAWKIRNAMPQAISIDNYLDAHANEKMELCGKIAIVQSILEEERSSKLYVKTESNARCNFADLEDTWYSAFFQMLTEISRTDDIDKIFDNLSFVIFNYDRCLEQYLSQALQNYFVVPEDKAHEIIDRIRIFRPYGSVSAMPWKANDGLLYGAKIGGERLLRAATNIKTFAEQVADQTLLGEMRSAIQQAETLVFLGFAFHEPNMKLLTAGRSSSINRVFATALGISSNDCEVISSDICRALSKKAHQLKIHIANKSCRDLFNLYWRSLSSKQI